MINQNLTDNFTISESMKKNLLTLVLASILTYSVSAGSFEVVQLPLPKSDKIVVKMMFRNGSVSDPEGKEGLTQLTASLMSDGSSHLPASSK